MKSTPLRRKTPLKRGASQLARTKIRAVSTKRTTGADGIEFPDEVKAAVSRRAAGRCEFPGCTRALAHYHHRQPRRRGNGTEANCLGLCRHHHEWVHAHPAESRENGWIVSGHAPTPS